MRLYQLRQVAVARSGSGFTVTNNSVSPAANVDFPAATGGTETATYVGIGTASSGTAITSPNGLTEGEEIVFSSSASDYVGQRPSGLSAGVDYTFFFWVRIADGGTAKDIRIQHYDGTSTNLLASPTISSN